MNESITADKCVSPRQFISQAKHAMSSHVVLVQLYQLRGVFEELWAVNQVLFICRTRSDPTSQMAYVTSRDIGMAGDGEAHARALRGRLLRKRR